MTTLVTETTTVSKGVSFFLIDNEAIIFSEERQELHALNTTAAFIWCCLDDGFTQETIVEILQDRLTLPKSDATNYVAQSLIDWQAAGLFEKNHTTATRQELANKKEMSSPAKFERENRLNFQANTTRYYKILGTYFAVYAQLPEQFKFFSTVLDHVAVEGPIADPVVMHIVYDGDTHILILEEAPPWRLASLAEIAPAAMGVLFERAIDLSPHLVSLHAAAVVHKNKVLLLPGAGGSGKSSLALALSKSGFGYLSDDTILVDDTTLEIKGVPFSICIKESGVEVASSLDEAVEDLPILPRSDGKKVRYLPPSAWPGQSGAYPLGWIVFPRYKAGCKTDVQPIRKVEALERLVRLCYLGPHLTTLRVKRLIELLESVNCYEMSVDELDDATDRLTKLVGEEKDNETI